jgi:membrane protein YdbS with pleckstrin-like domain
MEAFGIFVYILFGILISVWSRWKKGTPVSVMVLLVIIMLWPVVLTLAIIEELDKWEI